VGALNQARTMGPFFGLLMSAKHGAGRPSGAESNTDGSRLASRKGLRYTPRFAGGGGTIVLNVMRENLKHLKWVLWIVALSMLLYLGLYFNGGGSSASGGEWAARVVGVAIPADRFLDAARRQDDAYRRM